MMMTYTNQDFRRNPESKNEKSFQLEEIERKIDSKGTRFLVDPYDKNVVVRKYYVAVWT